MSLATDMSMTTLERKRLPTQSRIAEAYAAACIAEIDALKPGNVHRYAAGHGMEARDFIESARVSAAALTVPGAPLGRRVLGAIEATRSAVGVNTNLGIVLLCVPLAMAAETHAPDLRDGVATVLSSLDADDARDVFRAIVIAAPGGLGSAPENDVRGPAPAGLLGAMRQAAGRDRIARQYAHGFEDVFGTGLQALHVARREGLRGMWPAVRIHLAFLAAFADSHIGRKHGSAIAEAVRAEAEALDVALWRVSVPERVEQLIDFDASLKQRGLNPGTTADLTVATLLADALQMP